MAILMIQPHGRLNDWVADEKGYVRSEGLDYDINVEGSRKNTRSSRSKDEQNDRQLQHVAPTSPC